MRRDCFPRHNAARLLPPAVATAMEFLESDWFEGLNDRRFHLLLSNPPYVALDDPHLSQGDVRFEPRGALEAGRDGLAALRAIVSAAADHLLPGGWLLLEHGYDQQAACQALLAEAGFTQVSTRFDLGGQPRVSGGRLFPPGRD